MIEAGVDEAGRGPLAGPVFAAAVILDKEIQIEGLYDSKKISEKKRESIFDREPDNIIKEKNKKNKLIVILYLVTALIFK